MKIFKIILISFFVLLIIGGFAFFILIKTFDVQRFKPQILEAMTQVLGRKADFKDIHLQLSLQGIGVQLKEFTIQDHPVFSSGDLLKIQNISVGVDVLGYLSKKEITISKIQIDRPELTIVRLKNGEVNLATLGKPLSSSSTNPLAQTQVSGPSQQTASPPVPITTVEKSISNQQPPLDLPQILIHSIDVHNASITYVDKSFDPAMTIEISKLNIKIQNFSLKDPFSFHAEGSLLSADQNFQVDGNGVFNLENQGIQLKNIIIVTDLSLLSFAKLQSSVAALKGVEMPQQLSG